MVSVHVEKSETRTDFQRSLDAGRGLLGGRDAIAIDDAVGEEAPRQPLRAGRNPAATFRLRGGSEHTR